MCSPDFRQAMQIQRDAPSMQYPVETAHGYPVVTPRQAGTGVVEYLKNNPHVAGMAMGAGGNGSDPSDPRTIVVNTYNPMMYLPDARKGLAKIEAVRHKMSEAGYVPQFEISPEMQRYRESAYKESDAYLRNDPMFKESMVSRQIVGDVPFSDPVLKAEAGRFNQKYFPEPGPLSPITKKP